MARQWFRPPRTTVLRFAIMATMLIILTLARPTVITDLTGLSAVYSSVQAHGMAGAGAMGGMAADGAMTIGAIAAGTVTAADTATGVDTGIAADTAAAITGPTVVAIGAELLPGRSAVVDTAAAMAADTLPAAVT